MSDPPRSFQTLRSIPPTRAPVRALLELLPIGASSSSGVAGGVLQLGGELGKALGEKLGDVLHPLRALLGVRLPSAKRGKREDLLVSRCPTLLGKLPTSGFPTHSKKSRPILPGVSFKKWEHWPNNNGVMDPFLKGHGDSRYTENG